MKMFKYVLRNYFSHKGAWLVLLITIIAYLSTLLMPFLSGKFIDFLLTNKNATKVVQISFGMMGFGLVGTVINYIASMQSMKITCKTGYKILVETVDTVFKARLEDIEKFDSTYLTKRIVSDVQSVSTFVISNYVSILFSAFSLIAALFLFHSINYRLLYLVALLVPLYILLISKMHKPLYDANLQNKEGENKWFNLLNKQINNILDIKLSSEYDESINEIHSSFYDYFPKIIHLGHLGYLFTSLDGIISIIFQSIMFVVGGISIINQAMTLGEFTMINAYFGIILKNSKYYVNLYQSYQEASVSYARLRALQSAPVENNGDILINEINDISVHNLDFSYCTPEGRKDIIKNFSYHFTRPGVYAITGDNGAGKSTLFKLMLGLYSNYAGIISYNDVDLKNADKLSLRKNSIVAVPQDILLNSELVKEYIARKMNISESNVKKYLAMSSTCGVPFQDEIESMLNTPCNRLSGGEARKLTLWVAFQKKVNYIIIDEPATGLDRNSVDKLMQYVESQGKRKCIIIISHNSKIISKCSEILTLGDLPDMA